jgi:hypothetical protein
MSRRLNSAVDRWVRISAIHDVSKNFSKSPGSKDLGRSQHRVQTPPLMAEHITVRAVRLDTIVSRNGDKEPFVLIERPPVPSIDVPP